MLAMVIGGFMWKPLGGHVSVIEPAVCVGPGLGFAVVPPSFGGGGGGGAAPPSVVVVPPASRSPVPGSTPGAVAPSDGAPASES